LFARVQVAIWFVRLYSQGIVAWGGLIRVGNPLLLNFSGWFQRVNDPPLLNIFPPAQRVPTLRPSEFSKLSQHASEGPTLRPSEFSKHVRTFIICHIDHIKWLKT
jgi:hypothetical protein